ncbi:phage tail-collar fiber domain-containing protein [Fusobacterium sp. SYSU M8A802]
MAYRGLTAIGANYLATRLAQELPVEFTKVQIGAGTPVGNPSDVTNLQNYKLDAKILKKSQENNTVEITIQVVNDNIDQGFYLKEIGVFVNDDTEKLYWYCNEDNAQYIPAKTDSAIAFEIDIKMEVTNVESPILNWSGQGTWIDKEFLKNNTAKIKFKNKGQDVNEYSILGENIEVDLATSDIIGVINNEATLNQAKGNGWYKVNGYQINGMYGYGLLYAYTHEQTTQQIFFSHRGGIAWRQDWDSNISSANWQTIGGDLVNKLDKGTIPEEWDTAEKIKNKVEKNKELIVNNSGLLCDSYLLYLNDIGTKRKGYFYLDRNKTGVFKCLLDTEITVNSSTYFEDISNNSFSSKIKRSGSIEIVDYSSSPKQFPVTENIKQGFDFVTIFTMVNSESSQDLPVPMRIYLRRNSAVVAPMATASGGFGDSIKAVVNGQLLSLSAASPYSNGKYKLQSLMYEKV